MPRSFNNESEQELRVYAPTSMSYEGNNRENPKNIRFAVEQENCTSKLLVKLCSLVVHKCNGETKSHGKTNFNSRHNKINLQPNETSRQNKINSRQNKINSRQNNITDGRTRSAHGKIKLTHGRTRSAQGKIQLTHGKIKSAHGKIQSTHGKIKINSQQNTH